MVSRWVSTAAFAIALASFSLPWVTAMGFSGQATGIDLAVGRNAVDTAGTPHPLNPNLQAIIAAVAALAGIGLAPARGKVGAAFRIAAAGSAVTSLTLFALGEPLNTFPYPDYFHAFRFTLLSFVIAMGAALAGLPVRPGDSVKGQLAAFLNAVPGFGIGFLFMGDGWRFLRTLARWVVVGGIVSSPFLFIIGLNTAFSTLGEGSGGPSDEFMRYTIFLTLVATWGWAPP